MDVDGFAARNPVASLKLNPSIQNDAAFGNVDMLKPQAEKLLRIDQAIVDINTAAAVFAGVVVLLGDGARGRDPIVKRVDNGNGRLFIRRLGNIGVGRCFEDNTQLRS